MVNMSSLATDGRVPTGSMTATAADIRKGKRAFVNGQALAGTAHMKPLSLAGGVNRNLFLYQPPTGLSGSFDTGSLSTGALLLLSDKITGFSGATVNINTDGYFYAASAYQDMLHLTNLPTFDTSTVRKLEMWGKTKNAALTTNYGVRIGFNVQHWYNQFWHADLYWNGTQYVLYLYEWNSPTSTTRASAVLSSAINQPAAWHLQVLYVDDTVWATAAMYETDAIADDDAVSVSYSIASRPYKGSNGAYFTVRGTPGDEWLVRGCSISDEP